MKQTLLLTLFFAIGIFTLHAQSISFEYVNGSPDKTFMLDTDYAQDIPIKGMLRNNTSDTLMIQWIREEVYVSEGWETAICDPIRCYLHNVSSKSFELPANENAIFDAHLYPEKMQGDSAVLSVSIVDQSNPNDTLVIPYYFYQENTSSTNRFENTNILLYPNPASTYFKVKSDEVIGSVEVLDILGKQIKFIKPNSTTAFIDVLDLMKGIYIVRIKDSSGAILKTQRLRKELP